MSSLRLPSPRARRDRAEFPIGLRGAEAVERRCPPQPARMLRIFPEIENPRAAPCDERNIVGAVENRCEHLTIGCKARIANTRQRRRILRLDPGECPLTVDLFEPQIRIVVGCFERRAGIDHQLARTASNPCQLNSTPCPGRSGTVAKPSAKSKGCIRNRSSPKP